MPDPAAANMAWPRSAWIELRWVLAGGGDAGFDHIDHAFVEAEGSGDADREIWMRTLRFAHPLGNALARVPTRGEKIGKHHDLAGARRHAALDSFCDRRRHDFHVRRLDDRVWPPGAQHVGDLADQRVGLVDPAAVIDQQDGLLIRQLLSLR